MNVYWYQCGPRHGNYGDQLTSLLLDYCDVPHRWAPAQQADLIGIGSVLSHIAPSFEGSVWSSGAIRAGEPCDLLRAKVFALRGRLSLAQSTVRNRQEICLGDGGLLAHLLYRGTAKRYAIGFVPHYCQQNDPLVVAIGHRDDVQVIDICGDPQSMLEEIGQCEYILSSSLHGLILADSLGIPNRWVEFPSSDTHIVGGRFKFRDYYSVFGLDDAAPWCISSAHDLDSLGHWVGDYERPGIEDIKRSLLESLRDAVGAHSKLPWEVASQPIGQRLNNIRSRLRVSGICEPLDAGKSDSPSDPGNGINEPSDVKELIETNLEQAVNFCSACLDALAEYHRCGVAHGALSQSNMSLRGCLPVLQRFGWRPAISEQTAEFASRFAEYCREDLFAFGKWMSRAASQWSPCRVVAQLLTHPDKNIRVTELQVAQALLAAAMSRPTAHAQASGQFLITNLMRFTISQNEQLLQEQKLNRQAAALNRALEIQLAGREIRERNQSSHAVIVIDEEQWRPDLQDEIATVPFPVCEGEYWGLPADDDSAIAELERMRLPTERLLAVLQPSFWWLDHYQAFADHLHASSRLLFKSERLWLFELFAVTENAREETSGFPNELTARD